MKIYPTFFYKYRSSNNCQHLHALFNSYAWLSSRKEFINLDPDDSKIQFNDITVKQLKIKRNENKNNKFLYRKIDKLYHKGCFTDEGRLLINTLEIQKYCDNLIDSLKFYCVSGNGDNETLWNQSNDFCIELRAEELKKAANNEEVPRMIYQYSLAELDLADFLPDYFLFFNRKNKYRFL